MNISLGRFLHFSEARRAARRQPAVVRFVRGGRGPGHPLRRAIAGGRWRMLAALAAAVGCGGALAGSDLTLRWADNSNNEAGFQIERSILGQSFARIATVGANLTSYTDRNLLPSTTYSYRVRAYNTAGNSEYSNTATATIPAANGGGSGTLTSLDIGGPSPAGTTSVIGSTIQITAGGRDIWEGSDQFRFYAQTASGDTELIARVGSLSYTDAWAKAGVMLRASSAANAAHVSVVATPGSGVSMQWRSGSGQSMQSQTVGGVQPPVWVRLTRSGNTFRGYYSSDGSSWQQIYQVSVALPTSALGGLAVTSHKNGTATTATFDNVTIGGSAATPAGDALTSVDVGGPSPAGATSASGSTIRISAGGRDIWENSDQFRFCYRPVSGDTELIARVGSLTYSDSWAKAGVMLRNSTSADAAHVSVVATPGSGVSLQWRPGNGQYMQSHTVTGVTAPVWVRLTRSGNTFRGYYSSNGTSWQQIYQITVSLSANTLGGLAVTSHRNGTATTASFDNVSIGGSPALPSGSSLNSADIGGPAPAGATSASGASIQISAGGRDIWEGSDQFRFAYQAVSGDAEIVARVSSLTYTDAWAKAGVMLRASTAASAAHVSVLATPGSGVSMQWRSADGQSMQSHTITGVKPPVWVRLTRAGNTFRGYYSSTGTNWQQIYQVSVALPVNTLGGLAVTSHKNGTATSAVFDSVSIMQVSGGGTASSLLAASETSGATPAGGTTTTTVQPTGTNLGAGTTGRVSSSADGSIELQSRSTDIWGTSDAFTFASQPVAADAELTVHVASLTRTNGWAKTGLMFRASLAADAAHASVFVTPDNGIVLQWRSANGDESSRSVALPGAAPAWLKMVRSGDDFYAFTSADGAAWDLVEFVKVEMPAVVPAGLALTSHNADVTATAVFDDYSIDE